MPKTYEGGCLCGDVRFEVTGPIKFPHTCSCKMCQRHSGSLTQVWIEVPRDRVKWTGKGGAPKKWRSSAGSSRSFCGTCGLTIGAIDDKPVVAFTIGTFDKTGAKDLMPQSLSYVGGRPKWWSVM
ncbi:MAG: GFA family protein [Alphaproteobacteria bacterium]|nr:GFA family protein [Alphaproteobacteria bacterium]